MAFTMISMAAADYIDDSLPPLLLLQKSFYFKTLMLGDFLWMERMVLAESRFIELLKMSISEDALTIALYGC